MSVIVQKASSPYGAPMVAAIFRLLALVALVIMPLGMTATPALAHSENHSMPMDHSMPAGHCDDQQAPEKAPAPAKMDCTAACTALPATSGPALAPGFKPKAPRTVSIETPFEGTEPEILTPPPRRG